MFKKLWSTALALWCAALPFLTQVTVSGWSVALEETELTSINSAMVEGASSMLNMIIQMVPTIVAIVAIWVVGGLIFWLIRKVRKSGRGK